MPDNLTDLPQTDEQWHRAMQLPGYDPWRDAGDMAFDAAEATRAIEFFHEMLKHGEGAVAGQPFLLERWQQAVVGNLFGWKRKDGTRRYREGMLYVPRKNGKLLALDTPIPTPTGWTTMGEIQEGDTVFGPNGQPCRVTWTSDVDPEPESYRLTFSNGESVRACGDHLWVTNAQDGRRSRNTREIFRTQDRGHWLAYDHDMLPPPDGRRVDVQSVERIAPVPMRCIAVDSPTNEYLCGRTMIPTHNTPLVAGIILCVMVCDGERGAQLYSAAAEKEQAALLFKYAAGMVYQNPELDGGQGGILTVYGGMQRRAMVYEAHMSAYRALSADAATKHGLTPSVVVIDEEHALPNRELVDTLATGMASLNRRNPLLLHVTTADYDRPSICNEKHAYACKVRDGEVDDPYFLPAIWEADRDDDWTDEKVWEKANPNLDVSVSREYLRAECAKAKANPALENTFRRLHLNQKTTTDVRWMPMQVWDDSSGLRAGESPEMWRERMLSELAGATCVVGLDLSQKVDLTACVALFPPVPGGSEVWHVIPWFWVPGENARKREKKDRVPYLAWARMGFAELTEGDWIDQDAIQEHIRQLTKRFDVREVAYDPWNAEGIGQALEREDIPTCRVRQGVASLSEPMKQVYGLALAKQLHHGGNPALRWMIGNTAAKTDVNGNIQPDKAKSTERIDGVSAMITAMARAVVINTTPGWDVGSMGLPGL